MVLDISKVKFSFKDEIKGIRFPRIIDENLAEDIGIHIGDGSMYKTGYNMGSYEIRCSGHYSEDKDHYLNIIIPLKKMLFNIDTKAKLFKPRENEFGFVICSKALFYFYNKIIEIPSGNKTKICRVPDIIMRSKKKIKLAFLRGLADTDFSLMFKSKSRKHDLHYYPVIFAGFSSKGLVTDLKSILSDFGFEFYSSSYLSKRYDKSYLINIININGKENLERWISLIGFDNPKHITKYLIWKRFGFCPPRTTLEQRRQILAGILNPYDLYKKELNGGRGRI